MPIKVKWRLKSSTQAGTLTIAGAAASPLTALPKNIGVSVNLQNKQQARSLYIVNYFASRYSHAVTKHSFSTRQPPREDAATTVQSTARKHSKFMYVQIPATSIASMLGHKMQHFAALCHMIHQTYQCSSAPPTCTPVLLALSTRLARHCLTAARGPLIMIWAEQRRRATKSNNVNEKHCQTFKTLHHFYNYTGISKLKTLASRKNNQ